MVLEISTTIPPSPAPSTSAQNSHHKKILIQCKVIVSIIDWLIMMLMKIKHLRFLLYDPFWMVWLWLTIYLSRVRPDRGMASVFSLFFSDCGFRVVKRLKWSRVISNVSTLQHATKTTCVIQIYLTWGMCRFWFLIVLDKKTTYGWHGMNKTHVARIVTLLSICSVFFIFQTEFHSILMWNHLTMMMILKERLLFFTSILWGLF